MREKSYSDVSESGTRICCCSSLLCPQPLNPHPYRTQESLRGWLLCGPGLQGNFRCDNLCMVLFLRLQLAVQMLKNVLVSEQADFPPL